MCIIIYHPRGVELPEKEVLERCWKENNDGAGFVIKRKEGLRLWKGFMNWQDFWAAYRTERLKKEDDFAIHFRWATSGGIGKGKCHPFPIVEDISKLTQLKFKPKEGLQEVVMHNGVLGKGKYGLSDTMIFVKTELAEKVNFLNDKVLLESLEKATVGNKLLFFWRGKVIKTGTWFEDEKTGLSYSNKGYKEVTYNCYGETWCQWWEDEYWKRRGKVDEKEVDHLRSVLDCPQCEMSGVANVDFSVSRCFDRITCLDCGCLFNLKGDILGFNETLWEEYTKRYKERNIESLICCPYCGEQGSSKEDPIEDSQDRITCSICNCSFNSKGIIFSSSLKEVEKRVHEVLVENEVCEVCGASEVNGSVMFDESSDGYFCLTCNCYI